ALLTPLVRHPQAIGLELTIYDPALDPDLSSAARLVTMLENLLVDDPALDARTVCSPGYGTEWFQLPSTVNTATSCGKLRLPTTWLQKAIAGRGVCAARKEM